MKNAEGWHAVGVTEGVVSRSYDGSRKKFVRGLRMCYNKDDKQDEEVII